MGSLLAAFGSVAALAGFAGVLLILPVIWAFAPLIPLGEPNPLDSPWVRAALCAVPPLAYAGLLVWRARRRRRRDAALVDAVAAPDPEAEAAREEEAELRERLDAALDKLRAAGGGKGRLYELPWYVIIGPPGGGKTTAIANSGLEFPFSEGAKLKGVGGTRSCEWWLSDHAVLIDTAGRYATQDSDAAADKAGWERFLDLLRRNRPRQPLNGVIVAFGADLISRLDAGGREAHARAVRRRVRELEERLGQRLPVYLVVSKVDLISGFVEFFDDLDRAGRDQVWGVTFPVKARSEGSAGRFGTEFRSLLDRLEARLLERLQSERGPQQRALIAGFPAQFASLEEPLAAFVSAAFGGTRLEPAPFLRGVYFASGTQEGTPLDRLTGALSRAFGLDARRPAAAMGQKGRAYFLGRLLREVVFNEARLAARDRGAERRRRAVAVASWAGAALAVAGAGAWGWSAYAAEQRRAAAVADRLDKAEQAVRGLLPLDRVADGDVARVLPYLDAARDLSAAARAADDAGLVLSQRDKLETGGALAYRHALDRVLLPRLLARLEAQMRAAFNEPEPLYERTRAYLMLGRAEGAAFDPAVLRAHFADDWARAHPGALGRPTRQALMGHLDALLTQDFARYPIDGALVDAARRVFSRLPLAERVYSRLRPLAQADEERAPGWRPADALGAAGERFFARASGRPLAEAAVPGLLTVEGLHRVLLPALPAAARAAASEAWVFGSRAAGAAAGADDPQRLEAAVLGLYAEDYARAWQAALDDLVLVPFPNLQAAAEGLNLLGAPNSPLRDVLRAVARQLSPGTSPDAPPPARSGAAQQQPAAGTAGGAAPSPAEAVARVVETRFRALREAAGQPIDDVLRIVSELYVQVARLAASPPGTALPPPAPGLSPAQRLQAEAARQPPPLSRWLAALANTSQAQFSGGAKAAIAAAGQAGLAPQCRGVETRFPFRRDAAQEVPDGDFARLFGPGGVFDQFFAQNLRPFVDTTQTPWRPVAAEGAAPPVTAADAQQFQRAAAIRDAFFPPGGFGPGLRFDLVPQGLDVGATGAVLEAPEAGRVELPRAGSARPIPLAWPSRGNLSLTFDPPPERGGPPLAFDGPWSAMRLAMGPRSSLRQTAQPTRLVLTAQQGERSATFELRAGSSVHPFGLRELAEFRCPALAP